MQPGHVLKDVSNQTGQFLLGILSPTDVTKWTPMTANNPDEMCQKHAFLITQQQSKLYFGLFMSNLKIKS